MTPGTIGDDLLARDADGRLRTRIATVFPRGNTIVTLPGIHATQRLAYTDSISTRRIEKGLAALTEDEEEELWLTAVDLILDDDNVLIRPDPADMGLAFEADELLQQIVSKKQIKFLHVLHPAVRQAIKRRGECWRINPLPRSPAEMSEMIASSRIGIGGREIYYYNSATGTRVLTCQQFGELAGLAEPELRQHLTEIREFCGRSNRMGNPEVALFKADSGALAAAFEPHDLTDCEAEQFQEVYESLRQQFESSVPPEFRRDDPHNPLWRSGMYATLIGQTDKAVSEESLLGLSAEFFMQVEWVPGGRVEDGEFMLDEVFDEEDCTTAISPTTVSDPRARGLIFNFLRDYGDVEHLNLGRVAPSLSRHKAYGGRRSVYLAEIQQREKVRPILRIIRMQKVGVWEHLDGGKDLLTAILRSEEYTEYILDRRLACRQLGMNLPPHVTARKLCERYAGTHQDYQDAMIWSTYFERDYITGLATDKIPATRFADPDFAEQFARLLGRAAAPNLVVGRADIHGEMVFDEGGELITEDECGHLSGVVVIDHAGTFMDCERDLHDIAPAYANCISRRIASVPSPSRFVDAFLEGMTDRLRQIQHDYRKRAKAFDALFKYQRHDEEKRFARSWRRALDRLDAADTRRVADSIRSSISTQKH